MLDAAVAEMDAEIENIAQWILLERSAAGAAEAEMHRRQRENAVPIRGDERDEKESGPEAFSGKCKSISETCSPEESQGHSQHMRGNGRED